MSLLAQEPPTPSPAQIDAIFGDFDRAGSPGCSIAIERGGRLLYAKGYGLANLAYGVPNGHDTPYHVASLSKQVTAFAIQLLAAEGKLVLSDDVRKYVPEMHDFGRRITLEELLHHTSGLRDQWDLLGVSDWRMDDVITQADVLKMLYRQTSLNFDPGSRFDYCNSGYTLLALVVERVSGETLRTFCQDRVFGPLGMTHTEWRDDYAEIVSGRAESYFARKGGGFKSAPLQQETVGATGLTSTATDLAKWTWNLIHPTVGGPTVSAAMRATTRLADGKVNHYASGLLGGSYRGLPVWEHLGADAGYRSGELVFPDQQLSVVCLANVGTADPASLDRKVADLYLGLPEAPPAGPAPPSVAVDAARYAGIYEFEPGLIGTLTIDNGQLMASFDGGDPVAAKALSPTEFRFPGTGRCTFSWSRRGFDCRLSTGDNVDDGVRLEPPPADLDLRAFVGTYRSDELRSTCDVTFAEGKLHLAFPKWEDGLQPVARDRFLFGSWVVHFLRGRRGRVGGLSISSQRSYDMRFNRTG